MTDKMTDKEILKLKKDILEARRRYAYYVIPIKIRKKVKNKYTIHVKCPFCYKIIKYENCLIRNRLHYQLMLPCRNCNLRFWVTSFLYKVGVNHYQKLDFLRRNYLLIKDNLLKKKL